VALVSFELRYRDMLPGTPPALCLPAARYGATMLYQVCRFLVHRDLGAEAMECAFRDPLRERPCPSVHYSVDLSLRFLPDVERLTREKAPDDPMLAEVTKLANQWPLSSVGIPGLADVVVDTFVTDPCLRRLYVDRIIDSADVSRLRDNRIRDDVAAALGAHPELAPPIAQALDTLGPTLDDGKEQP
jgi:hypothetical protein